MAYYELLPAKKRGGIKVYIDLLSGPSSYSNIGGGGTGHKIDTGLKEIWFVVARVVTEGDDYAVQVYDVSGGVVTLRWVNDIEQSFTWSNLGSTTATFATKNVSAAASGSDKSWDEVPDAADLSAESVFILAIGRA